MIYSSQPRSEAGATITPIIPVRALSEDGWCAQEERLKKVMKELGTKVCVGRGQGEQG